MKRTDKDWEEWGAKDPYFAVVTSEKYRSRNITEDAKNEFFKSGKQHIADVFDKIRRHLNPDFSVRRAVDFGCGTGRMLLPLSQLCSEVVGVDVADSMLAEAGRNCARERIRNVSLVKSDDDLSQLKGEFDLVHSVIVFQHIAVTRGEWITAKLIEHLSHGGVAVLHYPYYRQASLIRRVVAWVRHRIPYVHYAVNMIAGGTAFEPPMQLNVYDLNKMVQLFRVNHVGKVYYETVDQGDCCGIIFYCLKS